MALLIALLLLALTPQAAFATFPGRNGDLVVVENGQSHPINGVTLWRFNPRSGRLLRDPICEESPYGPEPACFRAGPPAVSRDGRSVAVVAQDRPYDYPNSPPYPRESSLRVLSLDTGIWTQVRLSGRYPVPYGQPIVRWTPGGNFLLVVALDPITGPEPIESPPAQAVLAAPDGSDLGPVTADIAAPDVADDGRLAFVRAGDVHVMDPGGASRRVTFTGGDQPSWSPHGRFLAFSRNSYVHVVRARGGRAVRITRGFEPAWSPDGKRIAFFRTVRDREYHGDEFTYLYVLNRGTGRVRRVSSQVLAYEGAYADATLGLDWQVAR